jgi:hypothetical protein
MPSHFDKTTERWTAVHPIYDNLSVTHKSRSEAEAELDALARRYLSIRSLSEPNQEEA